MRSAKGFTSGMLPFHRSSGPLFGLDKARKALAVARPARGNRYCTSEVKVRDRAARVGEQGFVGSDNGFSRLESRPGSEADVL